MQCVRCGSTNPDGNDVRFCRACGAELTSARPPIAPVPVSVGDAYAPAQSIPPADGSAGQALPALPAAPIIEVAQAAPVAPITPAVQTAPATPIVQVALAPGVVHIAVSPYGGFWIRLVAWVIDAFILVGTVCISLFGLGLALGLVALAQGTRLDTSSFGGLTWLVILAVSIPYWLLFPPLLGATPGKLALGYHIVGERGRHLGLRRSLGRMLAQIPSAMVLGLGYAWIGFDARKQGWHDQIAKTYVVRKEVVRS